MSPGHGMGALVAAVASRLEGVNMRTGARVRTVTKRDDAGGTGGARYAVEVDGGEAIPADHVVLATPAHAAADALRALDPSAADALAAMPYASTATVFLAYRRADVAHPLDAVGFIVPRSLGRPLLAATWVSSKWEHRAPEGCVLMRCFFGGAWGEANLKKDDGELVRMARDELSRFMGLPAEPLFSKVFRFDRSDPQPVVGHLARMQRVRDSLARSPGLYVIGSGIDGVGIPDCVRQAGAATSRARSSRRCELQALTPADTTQDGVDQCR